MPFVALIPLFVIWAVITSVIRAEHVKKQQAAKRNAEQSREEPVRPASRGSDGQLRPVQPSVQVPQAQSQRQQADATLRTKPAGGKTPVKPAAAKRPQAAPAPVLAAEPLSGTAPIAAVQAADSPLSLEPQNILQGVLFAEIFGKPKALR